MRSGVVIGGHLVGGAEPRYAPAPAQATCSVPAQGGPPGLWAARQPLAEARTQPSRLLVRSKSSGRAPLVWRQKGGGVKSKAPSLRSPPGASTSAIAAALRRPAARDYINAYQGGVVQALSQGSRAWPHTTKASHSRAVVEGMAARTPPDRVPHAPCVWAASNPVSLRSRPK